MYGHINISANTTWGSGLDRSATESLQVAEPCFFSGKTRSVKLGECIGHPEQVDAQVPFCQIVMHLTLWHYPFLSTTTLASLRLSATLSSSVCLK